jgi:hypothetical protein
MFSAPSVLLRVSDRVTAMAEESGFRVRLRVRIAKGLTTDETSLVVVVANKNVAITSQNKNEPLSKAKWIVLNVRGFTTEAEAQHFGTRLCAILQLAALSSRLGVDAGDNTPSSWVDEQFARSQGLIKEHERLAPNIHGLAILADDDSIRFPLMDVQATVTANPEHFASALRELGDGSDIDLGVAANGVRLLNLALMTTEPLAQMVLALSAIEELGQNQKWSEAQMALIKQLAAAAEASSEVTAEQGAEVAKAIETGVFRLSLRQGVMRLLSSLYLDHLRKEWDRLYSIRSGIFHGTARLTDAQLSQAALDTITLCGRIILAIVAKEGQKVPSIAATHFNPTAPTAIQR